MLAHDTLKFGGPERQRLVRQLSQAGLELIALHGRDDSVGEAPGDRIIGRRGGDKPVPGLRLGTAEPGFGEGWQIGPFPRTLTRGGGKGAKAR